MTKHCIDISGQRFGTFTVLERVYSRDKHPRWALACDCGASRTSRAYNLKLGNSICRSCLPNTLPLAQQEALAQQAAYMRRYAKNPANRMKINARNTLNSFVRSGKILRRPCEKCGAEKTHGHHDDYSKPLEVRWLCRKCHAIAHQGSQTRTHCVHGHERTGINCNGKKYCKTCARIRMSPHLHTQV